jgi:hypothetical protein
MDDIIVELADGRRLSFPQGTSPEVIDRTVQSLIQAQGPAEQGPESQKLRSALSGLTFNFWDEIEGTARSVLTGRPYAEVRDEIRKKISDYQEANPGEALTMEVLGAAAPTALALLIPGGQGLGVAGLARIGGLAGAKKVAKVGAVEGGVSAYGAGEQGALEDLYAIPTGVATGAATGIGFKVGADVAGNLLSGVTNQARSMFGNKAGTAVQAEVNRIVDETGKTADEVIADLISGRLLSENETLIKTLRAYMAKGGEAAAKITSIVPQRAQATRQEAMGILQEGMTPGITDNVYAAARQSDEAFKRAQSAEYNRVFSSGQEVSRDIVGTIEEAMIRLPNARADLDAVYKSRGNLVPFYKFDESGRMQIVRQPTIEDAEIVRQAIDEAATKAFREGSGQVGSALAPLQSRLRSQLDTESPELANVRRNWRDLSRAREAYDLGTKSLSKSADEIEFEFNRLLESGNEGAIRTFRAGVMTALRNRANRSPGFMERLASETTSEGLLLRTVFPSEQLDSVINSLANAGQAQRVKNKLLDASPTSIDLGAQKRVGDFVSAGDVQAAIAGSPRDMVRVGVGLLKALSPELTDKQRSEVVDIIMTQDPDVLRRALLDQTSLGELQRAVSSVLSATSEGVQRSGRMQAGERGGRSSRATEMMIEGLMP